MYTLDYSDVAQFDVTHARKFMAFWKKFYKQDSITVFGSKDRIDYFAELNLGKDLTEENLRRLLRWKDPRFYSGQQNPRVLKVLNHLNSLNDFRNGRIPEDKMRGVADRIFESGVIMKAFLLHVAKPHVHPIADKNVFGVLCLHRGQQHEDNWETYEGYSSYFGDIATALGIERTTTNVQELKKLDEALITFGRFLQTYYKP